MQLASSGGRRLKHAALAARKLVLDTAQTVSRKELSAAAREAEKALQLSPPQRLILGQLVACWGEQSGPRLLVWPSNARLVSTTGLSERAIRNAIRALIELQVLTPKDSPNGKRYAVRNAHGVVVDAFGFDLTPLFARRSEWLALVSEQKRVRDERKRAFDDMTICRRATEEALRALAQHFPDYDRSEALHQLELLRARTPRRSGAALPNGLLEAWRTVRDLVENAFYRAGCDGTKNRHIESDTELSSEACKGPEPARPLEAGFEEPDQGIGLASLVSEACPVVCWYPGSSDLEPDLVAAGRYLRASLGAHTTAWDEASKALGPLGAAIAVIYVLQRHQDDVASGRHSIRNPGGFFRTFVRRVAEGRLNLRAELLALRRRRMS